MISNKNHIFKNYPIFIFYFFYFFFIFFHLHFLSNFYSAYNVKGVKSRQTIRRKKGKMTSRGSGEDIRTFIYNDGAT